MLAPIVTLIAWTLLVWIWMYAKRIPAMNRAGIDPQAARHPGSLNVLPADVRQVAENYNHLMEQPTIFYALAFAVQLSGQADGLSVMLGWAYVGLRVLHSLVQGTINIVVIRFTLFSLSTIVLMVLLAHTGPGFFAG
jgi:hypothetical protein